MFERAYRDRFGFRDLLVSGYGWFKVFVLGVFNTPSVLIGKEGWLYYTGTMDDYRGLVDVPQESIDAWRREFTNKAAFLARHNVRYLVVVAPNKESIYPEYLPDRVIKLRDRTRLDQLLEAFGPRPTFELLDLRDSVRAAKATHGRVYQFTDSHWNDIGTAVAAEEIIKHLRTRMPDLPVISWGAYRRIEQSRAGGDLARMMSFKERIPEAEIRLKLLDRRLLSRGDMPWKDWVKWDRRLEPGVTECHATGRTRRAILSSDSFGVQPSPILAAHFARFAHVRPTVPWGKQLQQFVPRLVEHEHPDVYIELMVERNFENVPEHVFGE